MKFITDPIIKTSKDLAALSTRVFDGSVEFLKTTWNSIPLFAGAKAHLGLEGVEEDQTHYFLIPFRASKVGYALGTARVLPEGVGPENELPKRKIFHIPYTGGEEALKDLLRDKIAAERLAEAVLHAYDDILGKKRSEEEAKLDPVTAAWIRSLEQYLED